MSALWLEVLAVHVAQRDHLDAAGLEGGLDVHHAVPAAADQAELELAVGIGGPEHRRERGECRRAHGGGVQELASRDSVHGRSVANRTGRDKLKNTSRAARAFRQKRKGGTQLMRLILTPLRDKKPTDKEQSVNWNPAMLKTNIHHPVRFQSGPRCSSRPCHPRRVPPTRFRRARWPATCSSPTRKFPKPTTPGSPCMSPPGLCWSSIRGNVFKPACSAPGCSPSMKLRLRSNSIPTSRAAWAGGGTRGLPRRRRSSSWAAWR